MNIELYFVTHLLQYLSYYGDGNNHQHVLRVNADDAKQGGGYGSEYDAAVLESVSHCQQAGSDIATEEVKHGVHVPGRGKQ